LYLICPNCGQSGDHHVFHRIGGKKILCTKCRAVLKIALKCPVCDGIFSHPFITQSPAGWISKLLKLRRRKEISKEKLKCPVCDFESEVARFDKVVVYNEEYSLMV
jgi:RNA polymerase subunit RPABC4/transcription elongation factor Spt4